MECHYTVHHRMRCLTPCPLQVFVGRLAMFGFASALIGEIATGRGALGQLELETGLPPWVSVPWFFLCQLVWKFLLGLLFGRGLLGAVLSLDTECLCHGLRRAKGRLWCVNVTD